MPPEGHESPGGVFTLGHSNRSLEDFLSLLEGAGIQVVVDVRRFPRSRRHPWFDREQLARTLAAAGIRYEWEGEILGGFRRVPQEERRKRLREILSRHRCLRLALMCAEEDPRRCHRGNILAPLLAGMGVKVLHLRSGGRVDEWPGGARQGRLF